MKPLCRRRLTLILSRVEGHRFFVKLLRPKQLLGHLCNHLYKEILPHIHELLVQTPINDCLPRLFTSANRPKFGSLKKCLSIIGDSIELSSIPSPLLRHQSVEVLTEYCLQNGWRYMEGIPLLWAYEGIGWICNCLTSLIYNYKSTDNEVESKKLKSEIFMSCWPLVTHFYQKIRIFFEFLDNPIELDHVKYLLTSKILPEISIS